MQQATQVYFEDVDLGDEIGPIEKPITIDTVRDFCKLWGSTSPRFLGSGDDEQGEQADLIVPGIMSMAMMAQLLTSWAPPNSLKLLDVVFRRTVPHAPVKIVGLVTDKRVEGNENLVECDIYLTDLDGERLIGGKAILSLPSRGG